MRPVPAGRCFGLGLEHDRRAVRVIRADEMHDIAEHSLEAHPDVGLDVLHDMPDVEGAVGVGRAVVTKSLRDIATVYRDAVA